MILWQLFSSFAIVGLFTMGGGYAALPLIYEQCVEINGWLTSAEYAQLLSIAEVTPGPIAINSATFVGTRAAGIPGAVAATLGFCALPFIIVSILYFVYRKYRKVTFMQGALSGLRPAVVGLIASAGLTILLFALWGESGFNPAIPDLFCLAVFIAGFAALRRWKISPIAAIVAAGALGIVREFLFSLN